MSARLFESCVGCFQEKSRGINSGVWVKNVFFQDDMGSSVRDQQEKQSHVWLRHVVVPMLRCIIRFCFKSVLLARSV